MDVKQQLSVANKQHRRVVGPCSTSGLSPAWAGSKSQGCLKGESAGEANAVGSLVDPRGPLRSRRLRACPSTQDLAGDPKAGRRSQKRSEVQKDGIWDPKTVTRSPDSFVGPQ